MRLARAGFSLDVRCWMSDVGCFEKIMSLKAFHLIFVTLLTGLSFGCAGWAFQTGSVIWGVTGMVAGILVIVYGVYFLRKLKDVSYL
jgi:hypothetical protein